MNLSKSIFAVIFALTLSFNSFANAPFGENDRATIIKVIPNTTKFVLTFENVKQENLEVKIYDKNLGLLYSESLGKKESIERTYDLKVNGTYTVILKGETYNEKREVTVKNTITNEFMADFAPKTSDNKAIATIKNNKSTVTITLTNEEGNILQEKTVTSENAKCTINLDNLEKGTYFLQVIGQDKAFYETYVIN
ncbi:T9SS type A sorting domain-containing protein [Bernardetia sp. Wsw4-3y2]|uniref:T9SS type A sorting domain-containing protein n=1 Tax=Bernardetia sp. Wsw4-3y2 TaxID=3127471 RepID=UPI0030D4A43D